MRLHKYIYEVAWFIESFQKLKYFLIAIFGAKGCRFTTFIVLVIIMMALLEY